MILSPSHNEKSEMVRVNWISECTLSSISTIAAVPLIQDNEFSGQSITSFTVPASIESLWEECFCDCVFLSEVTFAGISCSNQQYG
jgi:hypothetical protein